MSELVFVGIVFVVIIMVAHASLKPKNKRLQHTKMNEDGYLIMNADGHLIPSSTRFSDLMATCDQLHEEMEKLKQRGILDEMSDKERVWRGETAVLPSPPLSSKEQIISDLTAENEQLRAELEQVRQEAELSQK